MQDTYIKIWSNAARYQFTGQSPMTWLITNARNTSIDRSRTPQGDKNVADRGDVLTAHWMMPKQSPIAVSEFWRMNDLLGALSDDRRDCIKEAYLEVRSYGDLADRANVPLSAMRASVRRGLPAMLERMIQ